MMLTILALPATFHALALPRITFAAGMGSACGVLFELHPLASAPLATLARYAMTFVLAA